MARPRTFLAALVAASFFAALPAVSSGATESREVSKAVALAAKRAPKQAVRVQMHPQIAQPGTAAASASSARSAMTVTLKPRKNGRPVVLQRKQGKRWVKVAKTRQKGTRAEFTAPYARKGKPVTYRASAARYRGLKPARSKGVSTATANAPGFLDDFTGSALNATKWASRAEDYQPSSQRSCSKASPAATRVAGGTARLNVLADPPNPLDVFDTRPAKCTYDGARYDWRLNGHIGTQGQYSFTYGYAAARIKFQPRRGQHGAFWMMPQSQAATEGLARDTGAEVDVIEYFGDKAPYGGLASFIHHWPDNGKDGITSKKVGGWIKKPTRFGKDWAQRYHVFSVEWTPKSYVFRIDGKETFRTSQGVSARPQYLILSLLSSDYELKHLKGDKNLPQTMSVDWVRTWEQ